MTIRKKLLLSFGLVLAIMLVAFCVSVFSMMRERATKAATWQAMDVWLGTGNFRFYMMQSRLSLSNYLLTGDARELEKLRSAQTRFAEILQVAKGRALNEAERAQIVKVEKIERDWNDQFASKMLEQRRLVDAGKADPRQLRKAYLQLDPQAWVQESAEIVDRIRADNARVVQQRRQGDETAAYATALFALIGMPLALVLGVVVAYRTSRSITEPLDELSAVARKVADSGDLNQLMEIKQAGRETEQLARAYTDLVHYLKEMASVSEAIARGDLSVNVHPHSPQDTLALAFSKMTEGLRNLVRAVRDAASQVAQRAVGLGHR
jgi:methyl-accepting chemotaxis protein